jgi:hypothetical protein
MNHGFCVPFWLPVRLTGHNQIIICNLQRNNTIELRANRTVNINLCRHEKRQNLC